MSHRGKLQSIGHLSRLSVSLHPLSLGKIVPHSREWGVGGGGGEGGVPGIPRKLTSGKNFTISTIDPIICVLLEL